jgi:hypothetical protein
MGWIDHYAVAGYFYKVMVEVIMLPVTYAASGDKRRNRYASLYRGWNAGPPDAVGRG